MLIVEFVQTRDIAFPHPFQGLPEPYWGRPLAALAFSMVLLLFLSGRLGVAQKQAPDRSDRWLAALSVLVFTVGCFTHFYGVSDEVAVNLEHAWNLFHSGRFSMSPVENVDGTIELLFYLLHVPFAGSLELLMQANYVLALLFTVGCVWLLHRQFLRVPGALRHTWLFMLLVFPLIGTCGNGFGASFFSFWLLLGATWTVQNRLRLGRSIAVLLPLIRPEAFLWSLVLLNRDKPGLVGWRAHARSAAPWLLGVALAAAAYYLFFLGYYGHWKPTPVLNKTLSLEGYRELFRADFFARDLFGMILAGITTLLLAYFGVTFSGLKALEFQERRFLFGGFAVALFYVAYFSAGNASMVLFGNWGFRYFAPALSFAIFGTLVMAERAGLAVPSFTRATFAALVLSAPVAWALHRESPVYTDKFVNRQWAVRAGYIADYVTAGTDLRVATSELNTFGLMLRDRGLDDYWTYTDRYIASSPLCSGEGLHWRERNAQFPNRFDLFWVWFTSLSDIDDLFLVMDIYMVEHLQFARNGGRRLGDIPQVLRDFDMLMIRLRSGEMITFLVRPSRGEEIAAKLQELGITATRVRNPNWEAVQKRWAAQEERIVRCS